MELVDVGDSKSPGGDTVPVRVRPGARNEKDLNHVRVFFCIIGSCQLLYRMFSRTALSQISTCFPSAIFFTSPFTSVLLTRIPLSAFSISMS